MAELIRDPDRLLPAEPSVRALARRIYAETAPLPIISPHGHVDPNLLVDDPSFGDPASLFVTPDHYITRLLHANGLPLESLGLSEPGTTKRADPRSAWRLLCEHWREFRATPSRYWLEDELVGVFDVHTAPGPGTADALFDELCAKLAEPRYRPRALFDRFGIEVLATTDDPSSDLAAHEQLAGAKRLAGRVVPTFRPDGYLDLTHPAWRENISRLASASGIDTQHYRGFVEALEARRRVFLAHGATATDGSPFDAGSEPLEESQAAKIYASALSGQVAAGDAAAFRRHMLSEMARMSCDDGLVMQLHPSILRNHDTPTYHRFGPDTGHDVPVAAEFSRSLRPLLERYGNHPNFRMVLFTTDETVWSREIAPLAGYYPSVYIGAPWWFLDTPDTLRRFREAVTDTAGFYRTAGFVDDTRAFCSIPARHDVARRVDAGYLARLVIEGRLSEDEAVETARDLVTDIPRHAFRL